MLQRWSFHVDHVDIWFKSRVDCPLRRVGIFRPESSFILVMAASIRFSLGKAALESIIFKPLSEAEPESKTAVAEIMPVEFSSRRNPVWRHIQHAGPGCEVLPGSGNFVIGMKTLTNWSRTGYLYAWHGSQVLTQRKVEPKGSSWPCFL